MSAENGRKFCLPRRITCRVRGDTMPVTTSPAAGKEASVLVKGVSRRVIVVDSPDPRIFEQAIFILPTDGGGVSSRQLVDEAVRIARSYARGQTGARRRWRPPAWLWAVWGACACGLVWLLAALL